MCNVNVKKVFLWGGRGRGEGVSAARVATTTSGVVRVVGVVVVGVVVVGDG